MIGGLFRDSYRAFPSPWRLLMDFLMEQQIPSIGVDPSELGERAQGCLCERIHVISPTRLICE